MKKFFWLVTGVAAGLVIAKQIESNPKAQAAVEDATNRAKEFGAAIAEGFKEREAELVAASPSPKVSSANSPAKKASKPAPKPASRKAPQGTAAKPVTKATGVAKSPATKKTSSTK